MRTASDAESETVSTTSADTVGGNETYGTNEAETIAENDNWAQALAVTHMMSPHLIPILDKEAAAPVFLTIEEQIVIQMVKIARLRNRHAYVLTSDMDEPVMIKTPDINRPDLSRTVREIFTGWYQRESGLAVDMIVARQRIKNRDAEVLGAAVKPTNGEPTTYRRRLSGDRKRLPDNGKGRV